MLWCPSLQSQPPASQGCKLLLLADWGSTGISKRVSRPSTQVHFLVLCHFTSVRWELLQLPWCRTKQCTVLPPAGMQASRQLKNLGCGGSFFFQPSMGKADRRTVLSMLMCRLLLAQAPSVPTWDSPGSASTEQGDYSKTPRYSFWP